MVKRERNGDIIMNGTHYVTYDDYQKLKASHAELVGALEAVIEYGTWIGDGWIPDEEALDKAQAALNKARAVGSEDSEAVTED